MRREQKAAVGQRKLVHRSKTQAWSTTLKNGLFISVHRFLLY